MKKLLLSTVILFIAVSALAQGGLPMKTGQKHVTAIVDHGSGWVQVKRFPGNNMDGTLSYYQKSFVSFFINGKVYTNNDVGLPSPLPANTFIMKDGVLSRIKGKSSNTDTIRCVWPNKDGVDLIQEVYPVLLERGEQIVFRWKAANKTTSSINVAVQYLLDVQVGDQNFTNDGAPVLTRYGYSPNWRSFNGSDTSPIPTYYMSFQHPLPNSPTFDPGLDGTGYTDNTYYPLGLTKPSRITIGNWPDMIPIRWGLPTPLPNGQYTDCAVLLEFGPVTIGKNKESGIALTSYGSGEFATCVGQLFGIVIFPARLKWTHPNLEPNPFTVEFHAFNPQQIAFAPGTTLTLTVGKDLTILGPSPVLNNGKSQKQAVQKDSLIPPLGVGTASWTLQATKDTLCSQDIISSLQFFGVSPQLGFPIFVNNKTGSDTCEHTIIIECASPDTDKQPPILDPIVITAGMDKQITAHDDRANIDSGLKSFSWKTKAGTDSSKFIVSIDPVIAFCSKAKHTVTIHQIDTVIGGCIDLTFEDCAGNKKDTTVCFDSKTYVPPDTMPPLVFEHVTISKRKKEFKVSDNRVDDTGIKEAQFIYQGLDSVGIEIIPPLYLASRETHVFIITQLDTLRSGCAFFQISDVAGNITLDSICFVADSTLGVPDKQNEDMFSILGNPSSGKTILHLNVEKPQDVTLRIVDALGREVRRIDVKGLSQGENLIPLQTSELASGTYYVIVEIDSKQFTKSLKVVR